MNPKIIYFVAGLVWGFLLTYLFIEVKNERFSTPSTPSPKQVPFPKYPNQYELEIMTSEYRLENKLNALKHDEQLCNWADIRKEEIKTDWSHDGFKSKYSANQLTNGYLRIGENITKDFSDSKSVFNAWKNSSTHNENLLRPQYTSVCVRCQESYCVQIFGAK